MEKVSFSCAAFAFYSCEPRQRKRKCKDKKKTSSIGSMPQRRTEVESKMASSILHDKLAENVRKYPVLYDKRCADKMNLNVALTHVTKELGQKTVCFRQKILTANTLRFNTELDFKLFTVQAYIFCCIVWVLFSSLKHSISEKHEK